MAQPRVSLIGVAPRPGEGESAAAGEPSPPALGRRLVPLRAGVVLQGFLLWVPVEKLFQTQIGFNAASIGLAAAAYAAVVPLLEVPSGILADRWSRSKILMVASAALAASSLVGGLSTNVATYIAAAMILGVYFALNSGTVDSIVYDTVLEETGSSALYEQWIGRVRIAEGAAFAVSALAGGLVAGWASPRLTYFLAVPFALASLLAFARVDEPQLHRAREPAALRRHVATAFTAVTRVPQVRQVMLLAALAALLSQAVIEFGPLWLVSLHAPAAAFGPYWAALVAAGGLGGYLTSKLGLGRRGPVVLLAVALAATPVLLATSDSVLAVAITQTALLLVVAIVGIHAGLLLHDAVPSSIRTGVSSAVGTLSWLLFLPFSLALGWLLRAHGIRPAGWVLLGVTVIVAVLLAASARRPPAPPAPAGDGERDATDVRAAAPADVACRELVALVTDYLDGVLPAGWRAGLDRHLADCDGCTTYLQQVGTTIDALARLDRGQRPPQPVAGTTAGPGA
ncbi:MAG TPA: MFS transporter [Streptosporangiaceae bacterium]